MTSSRPNGHEPAPAELPGDRLLALLARQRALLLRDGDAGELEQTAGEIEQAVAALAAALRAPVPGRPGAPLPAARPGTAAARLDPAQAEAIGTALRDNRRLLGRLADGNRRALTALFGTDEPLYKR
ncbi:MAG: hypothetical protein AB7G13_32010 [Lautropia sp.]